jgi:hypothetical protein
MIVRKFLATLAAAVGLAPAALGAATPQSVSPQAAPSAWVAYAEIVNQAITAQLSGSDPAAVRLHAYLDQTSGPTENAGVRLPIQVWINGNGLITKIDFTPFAQQQPNTDLRALLTGFHLSKAPPRKMLLPIRLTISVDRASSTIAPASMTRISKTAPIRT